MQHTSRHAVHRRPCSKRGFFPSYRTNKRWPELKIFAVCDNQGRGVRLPLTAGQVSDFKGADVLLADLSNETEEVIGYRGYDSNKIRQSLARPKHHRLYFAEEEQDIKAILRLESV